MMLLVLQHPTAAQTDFRSLRMMSYGGLPIADCRLPRACWPRPSDASGCGMLQIYGMTEAMGPVTWLLPEDDDPSGPRAYLLRKAGTPSPGVEVRLVDPASGQDYANGEVGEVWVRAHTSMRGYWRNAQATSAAFPEGQDERGGWMRTGDAGCRRDGFLYIHDRMKNMIISGGENIYPAEIENVLAAHPAVGECAVIGVPDEHCGEAAKACVVLLPVCLRTRPRQSRGCASGSPTTSARSRWTSSIRCRATPAASGLSVCCASRTGKAGGAEQVDPTLCVSLK